MFPYLRLNGKQIKESTDRPEKMALERVDKSISYSMIPCILGANTSSTSIKYDPRSILRWSNQQVSSAIEVLKQNHADSISGFWGLFSSKQLVSPAAFNDDERSLTPTPESIRNGSLGYEIIMIESGTSLPHLHFSLSQLEHRNGMFYIRNTKRTIDLITWDRCPDIKPGSERLPLLSIVDLQFLFAVYIVYEDGIIVRDYFGCRKIY